MTIGNESLHETNNSRIRVVNIASSKYISLVTKFINTFGLLLME
jgi:hypothetical protein